MKSKENKDTKNDEISKTPEEAQPKAQDEVLQNTDNSDKNKESEKESSQASDPKAESTKWKNEYLYLKAEFENFKKQNIKERSQLIQYSNSRILSELISVIDLLEQALSQKITADNMGMITDGVQMVLNKFRKILENFGLKEVEQKDSRFNPSMHEAIASEESHEVPEGHILNTFKKAYQLHDRIIRPAQVIVAKKPKNEQTNKEDDEGTNTTSK